MLATGIDYARLAHWTPRQLWEVIEESNRQAKEVEAAREGKETPVRPDLPQCQPPAPKAREPFRFKNWGEMLRGMGYERHSCWDFTPEELEILERGDHPARYAPFLVPREIVRARIEAEMHELNAKGLFEAGLPIIDSRTGKKTVARFARDDRRALQDLIERRWKRDCEEFDAAKARLENTGG